MIFFKKILKTKSDQNTHQNAPFKKIFSGGGGGMLPNLFHDTTMQRPSFYKPLAIKCIAPSPKSWLRPCYLIINIGYSCSNACLHTYIVILCRRPSIRVILFYYQVLAFVSLIEFADAVLGWFASKVDVKLSFKVSRKQQYISKPN